MTCRELHDNTTIANCPMQLSESWRHCPTCGRPTASVAVDGWRCEFRSDPAGQAVRRLTIRNRGFRSIRVELSVEATDPGLSLIDGPTHVVPEHGIAEVSLSVPRTSQLTLVGRLALSVADGQPDHLGEPAVSTYRCEIWVSAADAGSVETVEEAVFLRSRTDTRTVHLRNPSRQAVAITGIDAPVEFLVEPGAGMIAGATAGNPGAFSFTVRSNPAFAPPVDPAAIRVRLEGQDPLSIRVFPPAPDAAVRVPLAIVSIDFGTAYTSVAFRLCRYHDDVDDQVDLLKPPLHDETRFRTRIWVGKDGNALFGTDATKKREDDPAGGYLVRDLKTLLRKMHLPKAEEWAKKRVGPTEGALAFMNRMFGENWPEAIVTRYLEWILREIIKPEIRARLGNPDTYIQYVFSLPVLDFREDGAIYTQQRATMERCIRAAGYPMHDVQFAFEPVCAAMCLLHPDRGGWPALNTPERPVGTQTTVAVFDSGGGTTDVVVAALAIADGGRLELSVQSCAGIGSKLHTFGGEALTDKLQLVLGNTREAQRLLRMDDYGGALNLAEALHPEPPPGQDENDKLRDLIEARKREWVHSTQGVELPQRRFTLYPSGLAALVNSDLQEHTEALVPAVLGSNPSQTVSYLMCVGGNMAVPRVREWAKALCGIDLHRDDPRFVSLTDDHLQTGVAYGAVWVPDARIRNAVVYDLVVRCSGLPEPLVSIAKNSSEEQFGLKDDPVMVAAGSSLTFTAYACLDGNEYRLAVGQWCNTAATRSVARVSTSLQQGRLTVRVLSEDQPPAEPLNCLL